MKKLVFALVAMIVAGWGTSTVADPGQGIHDGPWEFNPYVNLTGAYDSNLGLGTSGGNQDDYFLDSEAGLKAGYSAYQLDFSGLGFVGYRNYSDFSASDYSSAGEILKFREGTHETVAIEADQTFRRIEDRDNHGSDAAISGVSPESALDASTRTRRDINGAGISMGHSLSEKVQMDAGYRYDEVNYEDPLLYDIESHMGQIETAYRMTKKTDAVLLVRGGVQSNVGLNDHTDSYSAQAGLKTHGTDKLSFNSGVGVQQFNRPAANDITAFNYELTASLATSEKTGVFVGCRNGILLSSVYVNNATRYDSVWGGAYWSVNRNTMLSTRAIFRRDDYVDPVPSSVGLVDRVDDGTAFRVRADYQTPAQFLRLFGQADYEVITSTATTDYNDTRIEVGAEIQY